MRVLYSFFCYLTLLILGITSDPIDDFGDEIIVQEEVHDSFKHHSRWFNLKISKCGVSVGFHKIPLPSRPNCIPPSEDHNKPVPVGLTLWKEDISSHSRQAYLCQTTKVIRTCEVGFFGGKSYYPPRKYKISSDYANCTAIHDGKNPYSSLPLEGGDISKIAKSSSGDYECKWLREINAKQIIVTVTDRTIPYNAHTDEYILPGTSKTKCNSNSVSCELDDGTLVIFTSPTKYKPTDCAMVPYQHDSGIIVIHKELIQVTGRHLKAIFSFERSGLKQNHYRCNETILMKAMEGTFVSLTFDGSSIPIDFEIYMKEIVGMPNPNDERLNFKDIKEPAIFHLSNNQLEYAYQDLKKRKEKELSFLHLELCNLARTQWEILYDLKDVADTTLVSIFNKNPLIRGFIKGSFQYISDCVQISEFKFLPNVNCSEYWPVSYVIDYTHHHGYLDPVHMEIKNKAGETNCKYYDAMIVTSDNQSYKVFGQTVEKVNVTLYLPKWTPTESIVIFPPTAVYNISDFSSWKTISESVAELNTVVSGLTNIPLTDNPEHKDLTSGLFSSIWDSPSLSPLRKLWETIELILVIVICVVVGYFIIHYMFALAKFFLVNYAKAA